MPPDGLSSTLRLPDMQSSELPEEQEIEIGSPESDDEQPHYDEAGNLLSIEFDDGSVEINLGGLSAPRDPNLPPLGWFDSLVAEVDPMELSRISEMLLRGISDDEASRKTWLEDRANAIKMLGFRLDVPGVGGSVEGAPVDGQSTFRHPLLAQAVLTFQANARSELLPTDGPAKIRDDNPDETAEADDLAEDFEKDLNHYLTVTDKSYYPDTDRMLIPMCLSGMAFKKVYYCPVRNRPVSETVDAEDLIVNNSATSLQNAQRATHRIMMPPNVVKRMQILGIYKDVDLGSPAPIDLNSLDREKKETQGVDTDTMNPEDRDREIYECYCELDIKGFEHKLKGKETGLEVPYRVTIDKTTRQILALVRDYDKDTEDLPERRRTFVAYIFIPGFGFYGLGFLHMLGNITNALTALSREAIDAGMFASFPGFLVSDAGGRQNTNIFRVPPGGGQLVKTGGMKIGDVVAPLPYKDVTPGLMAMAQNLGTLGEKMAGVASLQVGEGKQDMPVGTILAIIEQATKVENAIHKRMHSAQAEELQLIVECFREHPESFWERNKKPARPWTQATFKKALDSFDLVPQADPNTSSHTQRIMKAVALKQMAELNKQNYDMEKVDATVLRTIGYSQPDQFFNKNPAPPDPKAQAAQAKAQADQLRAQAAMVTAKANEKKADQPQGLSAGSDPQELALKKQANDLKGQAQEFEQQRAGIEDQNRDEDRQADLLEASMRLEGDLLKQHSDQQHQHDVIDHNAAVAPEPVAPEGNGKKPEDRK